tara:strand:- start:357 stop:542 length:186 start_codon:yes stop_codon:yes gene_type:complete
MLNAYNDHGQTALHICQVHGHEQMASMLIDAGAEDKPMLPCMMDDCNNECRVPHNCEEVHG